MKSFGFRLEALSAVELLAASFLADDEFCANAELVAANATTIRVITRNFFWFTGSFLTAKLELGASAARNCQQLNSQACTIPIERHGISLNRSKSRSVAAAINRFRAGIPRPTCEAESSGTRCQVSRVM